MDARDRRAGFTLIELLVVIAIIGLLASIVLASLASARAKARDSRRQTDIQSLEKALELFYANKGRYPSSADGTCAWTNSFTAGGCMQALVTNGFLSRLPTDPQTGADYSYDNWCHVPSLSNDQNYRMWANLENPFPAQLSLWWGGRTYGATTCIDPS